MVITEYGAETFPCGHSIRSWPWSEEYQTAFLETYHRIFDRHTGMTGEQIWNFADYQTRPGIFKVLCNKKGVFTRDRQPEASARLVRSRWKRVGVSKPQ